MGTEWDLTAPTAAWPGRRNYHEWFTIANLEVVFLLRPRFPGSGEVGGRLDGACTRARATNVEAGADTTHTR